MVTGLAHHRLGNRGGPTARSESRPPAPVTTNSLHGIRARNWLIFIGGTLLYAISFNFVGIAALNGEQQSLTAANQLTLGRHHLSLANQRTYPMAYHNSRWAHTTFAIDQVTVYRTQRPYRIPSNDGPLTITGIIRVHMKIHAGANIQTYPAAKMLTLNDGQRLIADRSNSDVFAGDLNQGIRTAGNIYFLVPRLNEVSDVTALDLAWDAALRSRPQAIRPFHAKVTLDSKK